MSYFVCFLCILSLELYPSLSASGKHTLEDVYDLLSRIDENLRKEERVRELTQTLQIDLTLKKMEKNLEEIAEKLDSGTDLERQMPKDVRSNLVSIGNKMENMESSVESLQDIMKKMNKDMQILNQFEQHTEGLKKELNHKLTKMMNILSSLYEMNKDLKTDLGSSKKRSEDVTGVDLSSTNYLIDSLESLERKIKEQLSVLHIQMRTELDSLKKVASTILYQCEKFEDDSKTDSGKTTRDSKLVTNDILHDIQKNLNRSQREIKQELHAGMQQLDDKISHLTNMSSKNQCAYHIPSENEIEIKETKDRKVEEKEETKGPCVHIPNPNARNCADLKASGNNCNGKYVLLFKTTAIMVYCDMITNGGGWTVIMRRGEFGKEKEITFNQNWNGYKVGFGDISGEFWLGNENIQVLTNDVRNELRIELKSFNKRSKNFTFESFLIEKEHNEYRLRIGRPINDTTRIMSSFNGRTFATYDRISDQPGNCAEKYKGGWWYRRNCIYPDITSERLNPDSFDHTPLIGMQSALWREGGLLQFAEMKIRPFDFQV